MDRIPMDPNHGFQLPDPSRPYVLCDAAGQIVGRYLPAALEPPMSREEMERRKQEKSGRVYTTAEVLALLENL